MGTCGNGVLIGMDLTWIRACAPSIVIQVQTPPVCCAAGPGATIRSIVVPPAETTAFPRIVTTLWGFAWPGLSHENLEPLSFSPFHTRGRLAEGERAKIFWGGVVGPNASVREVGERVDVSQTGVCVMGGDGWGLGGG